jgi:hypothetical protein
VDPRRFYPLDNSVLLATIFHLENFPTITAETIDKVPEGDMPSEAVN